MEHVKSAGGVVINKKDQILVVSQKGVSWSLPKGHIDNGEEALETAKREIYEESGIRDLKFIKELGSYERYSGYTNGITKLKTIFIFLFKTETEDLKPIDPENPEARWVNKDKVVDILTYEKDKEFFSSIIDKI